MQHLFKCSRQLTFEEFALRVAQNVKRLPASDAALVGKDVSGSAVVSLTATTPDARIWRKFHELYEVHLIGTNAVSSLTNLFIEQLLKQFQVVQAGETITVGVDEFMKRHMFRASTIALAGPKLFETAPELEKDFWDYDQSFMSLLYGLPRFMCRRGYDARDKCLESVKRWLRQGWQDQDWDTVNATNPVWEENFGSCLLRQREVAMEKYGVSLEGRASFEMGLIWSINSNAIPLTSWIIIEVLSRPHLHREIRHEIDRVVDARLLAQAISSSSGPPSSTTDTAASVPNPSPNTTILDITALKALPVLNAVYQECLRLRTSVFVVRKLRAPIHDVDGYTLKKDNLVIAASYLAHRDPAFWGIVPKYPAHEFWAERWLPQPLSYSQTQTASNDSITTQPEVLTHNSSHSNVSKSAGTFFPYGGGAAMCPGRNYARQEILAAVALFFAVFGDQIEPLHFVDRHGKYSERGPELGQQARGVAKIDRDLLLKLSPRREQESSGGSDGRDMYVMDGEVS